ncbi:MAG: phenylalanine--tRNA ligase subunit beta [Thermoplasmata archaeon M11B2D]|nr:MAG: phenylalanine--tRNA ligase subunit beta [Thermoplasmata archaeon M11B2D]PNX53312.1 MAG: phenylalanine--tRNA ligase subunit beta [Thermoplasmata archaeon M9B2D]
MPLVTFKYQDFSQLLGHTIPKETLIEKLPMIGGDFSHATDEEINIEFFPNRPDLTSVEGIARASRAFFELKTGLQTYDIAPSNVTVHVDPSVKKIRPFVTTALVKNVTMSNELIISLMGLQEKLHVGLGRNRKKVAIGVHNAEPVRPPFVYKAVDPDSVSFVPLAKDEPMTLCEILKKHEKGVDYAHLLEGFDRYPLIVDAHNNVLSFPPIINGSLTEVTSHTTEIFIDVTGTDKKAINYALNIVTTALAERGGNLYQTTVHDEGKNILCPDFTPLKKQVSTAFVNRILGTTFTKEDIMLCLKKMGHDVVDAGDGIIQVDVAAWRSDILHEVDLVEDVAVGYGFDRFTSDFPKALTFGRTLPQQHLLEVLRSIMIGVGFNEVTTFVISNKEDEFERMGLEQRTMVEIENPIGEGYSGLRVSLLPSLLKLLRENRHHPLPQRIFEIGVVVDEQARNRYHLAALEIDAKANFTECKSLVETVLRECKQKPLIKETSQGAFIQGRCAAVMKKETEIGVFGEIHPKTIQAFHLEHPIIAFELITDYLL